MARLFICVFPIEPEEQSQVAAGYTTGDKYQNQQRCRA